MTKEEVIKQFVKYVKEQKITVFVEDGSNTLHVFKTPENASWKKNMTLKEVEEKSKNINVSTADSAKKTCRARRI